MKMSNTYQYSEPIEGFRTVEFFRKVKEKIARETVGMTFEEYRAWSTARRKKYASRQAA